MKISFFHQAEVKHQVTSSRYGNFNLDDAYSFETGGPSKTAEQIKGVPIAFIVSGGITGGTGKKYPFGFGDFFIEAGKSEKQF